jgi:hypothetical protein
MMVGRVRAIAGLSVEHRPIKNHPVLKDNRAHTEIFGDKRDQQIRIGLMRAYRWVIAHPKEGRPP